MVDGVEGGDSEVVGTEPTTGTAPAPRKDTTMHEIRSTVVGNATADPSEKQHPNGDISAMVRIAVNSRYFDQSTKDYAERKTEFINVYARRALARNLLSSVSKGQPLVATGRLGSSEWTDGEGNNHFTLTLQAETIGHDLTFGTATFRKPPRIADMPDLDPRTGEISGRWGDAEGEGGTAEPAGALGQDDDATDGDATDDGAGLAVTAGQEAVKEALAGAR